MRELVSEPSWYGLILLLNEMNSGSASMGIAMEKLVSNNYSYWKLCMEVMHGSLSTRTRFVGFNWKVMTQKFQPILHRMQNYANNGRSNAEKPYLPCEL